MSTTKKTAAAKATPAKEAVKKAAPAKEAAKKDAGGKEAVKKTAPEAPVATPDVDDAPTRVTPAPSGPTTIAFVAGGPGDPSMVSVRAAALMDRADLVIVDAPAVEVARAYARPDAIVVAADEDGEPWAAADRAKRAVDAAKAGQHVVRVLAGDPALTGELLPEVAVVRRSKIHFDVIPSVSDISGVSLFAGFGLLGGKTREIRVIDTSAGEPVYAELVSTRSTLVFLHGADQAATIAERLMKAGAEESALMAITRAGTTVDQSTLVAPLAEVSALTKQARHTGPGIVVVGEVVEQRDKLNWFETKPLVGWRVLIPRTQDNAGPLIELLNNQGAVAVEVPTISVEPPRTPQQIDRAVHGLVSGRYEWIGFTSVNAVRAIREKLSEYGLDARSFAGLKVAAVGEQTVAALIDFGVRPDLVPAGEQTTSALLEQWPTYDSMMDPINRVFLPRADIATDTLVAGLTELGWEVEDITAFRTVRAAPPPATTREAIKTGGFDAVLFTSSSTVRNLVGIAGKPHVTTVVACIGPHTAKTAQEHGLRVDVLADVSTPEGLVSALAAHGEALRLAAQDAGEFTWRPSKRRNAARRKTT